MFSRPIAVALLFVSLACVRIEAGQEVQPEKPDEKVQRLIQKLEKEIEGKGGHPLIPGGKSGTDGEAAKALGKLGSQAAPAIPVLIRAIKEGDGLLPAEAGYALGQIGKPAVPALVEALSSEDSGLQHQASHALALIGKDARPAIPKLLDLARDENAEVRSRSAETLSQIASKIDAKVIDTLIGQLSDEDDSVRRVAAKGLGRIAPNSERASKSLIATLKDAENPASVCSEAAESLGRIEPVSEATISALTEALLSDNSEMQLGAATALNRLGPAAKSAAPALEEFLKTPAKTPEKLSGADEYAWELLHEFARTNAKAALNGIREGSK